MTVVLFCVQLTGFVLADMPFLMHNRNLKIQLHCPLHEDNLFSGSRFRIQLSTGRNGSYLESAWISVVSFTLCGLMQCLLIYWTKHVKTVFFVAIKAFFHTFLHVNCPYCKELRLNFKVYTLLKKYLQKYLTNIDQVHVSLRVRYRCFVLMGLQY